MGLRTANALLLLAACCAATDARRAGRLVRFETASGEQRWGMPLGDGRAELVDGPALGGDWRLSGRVERVGRLLSPIPEPPAIYGIGCNYKGHCTGDFPTVFFKNRKSLNSPGGTVLIPWGTNATDYEAELGVVIGKDCKDVTAEEALDCVLGYTALNDVSSRWLQANDNLQWPYSKSFDTHCPVGPVLVHKDELGDASGLSLNLTLNGKLMQTANTADMIFGVRKIIEFISMGTTIEAGTLIATGTPPGTGKGLVRHGDTMTVSLEKVGHLTNPVRTQPKPTKPAPATVLPDPAARRAGRLVRFETASGEQRWGMPLGDGRAELVDGPALGGDWRLSGRVERVGRLLSPIPEPPAIYGIGCNYKGHCPAAINPNPNVPGVFFKNRKSLNSPGGIVTLWGTTTEHFKANETARMSVGADYEAELGVVIGKDCKDVTAEEALDCVLGYTALNDFSDRWWQLNDGNTQFTFGKSFDTHCPVGPVLVHKDELGDASGLSLKLVLNGQVVQDSNTADLIFGVRQIIEFISKGTTIEAGTLIATGTPPGTGLGDVKHGDTMTVSLEKVGNLTNPVRCADPTASNCPKRQRN